MPIPDIKTERLYLRAPRPSDAEDLARALDDWAIAQWIPLIPHPYAVADAQEFIAMVLAEAEEQTWLIFDDEGLCGSIALGSEFGYWIAPRAWRRGYGTEAGSAVLRMYFQSPAAAALPSGYLLGNAPSQGLLAKLGFGTVPEQFTRHRIDSKASVTVQRMILTPEQWHAMNPWVIETPRLRLRPIVQEDAEAIARIGGHPNVAPMIVAATVPWPEPQVLRFIERFRWRGRLGFRMALELPKTGKVVGTIGVSPVPHVFYFLDPAYWGQGLATEALRGFVTAIQGRFGLTEIGADCFDDNLASQAVLRKVGFEHVGADMGRSAARVEPAPVSVYRLRGTPSEASQ